MKTKTTTKAAKIMNFPELESSDIESISFTISEFLFFDTEPGTTGFWELFLFITMLTFGLKFLVEWVMILWPAIPTLSPLRYCPDYWPETELYPCWVLELPLGVNPDPAPVELPLLLPGVTFVITTGVYPGAATTPPAIIDVYCPCCFWASSAVIDDVLIWV